jgi:hypothetical protein
MVVGMTATVQIDPRPEALTRCWRVVILVSREGAGTSIDSHQLVALAWAVVGHAGNAQRGRRRDLSAQNLDICGGGVLFSCVPA